MLRNLIRRGIRTAQDGAEPGPNGHAGSRHGKVIATYAHDQIVSGLPPAATPEEDRQLLR